MLSLLNPSSFPPDLLLLGSSTPVAYPVILPDALGVAGILYSFCLTRNPSPPAGCGWEPILTLLYPESFPPGRVLRGTYTHFAYPAILFSRLGSSSFPY